MSSDILSKKAKLVKQKQEFEKMKIPEIAEIIASSLKEYIKSKDFNSMLKETSSATGLPVKMLKYGFTNTIEPFTDKASLLNRVQIEFGEIGFLDGWVEVKKNVFLRYFSPSLIAYISASNIPGIEIQTLVNSLLVRSPTICRPSSKIPFFLNSYKKFMDKKYPEFSRFFDVLEFPSNDENAFKELFRELECLVFQGEKKTLEKLKNKISWGTKIIDYTTKISAIVLKKKDFEEPDICERIARDIILYHHKGCLSPFFIMIDNKINPREFSERLEKDIKKQEKKLGDSDTTFDKDFLLKRNQVLNTILFEKGIKISGEKYKIVYSKKRSPPRFFLPTIIYLKKCDSVGDFIGQISRLSGYFQAVAVGHYVRKEEIEKILKRTSAIRICPIGSLQNPNIFFPNRGFLGMRELTRLVVWEKEPY